MDAQRLLVVDDEPIVGLRLKVLLEKWGYSVENSTDGQAALDILRDNDFSIIITDLKMNGIDGFELTREARVMAPEVRVILITGIPSSQTIASAAEAGIACVLPKPFKIEELRQAITSLEMV